MLDHHQQLPILQSVASTTGQSYYVLLHDRQQQQYVRAPSRTPVQEVIDSPLRWVAINGDHRTEAALKVNWQN
jgi:hypothetical protein